jgi:mannose-6-phosphate isomerase
MQKLYPLKFEPILKDKIWGGKKLRNILNKKAAGDKAGESWEVSGFEDNVSVVSNGFLKGNDLSELIEVYMGDLVGDAVFERFGLNFPILVKFIEACEDLSIQVHPDDEAAAKHQNASGKTEMWYIIDCDEKSALLNGFTTKLSREEYLSHLQSGKLTDYLNRVETHPGDVFFIPAGRVHTIGAGILLAEIQQSSDSTYRIYDFDRTDEQGNKRVLHTDLALEVIDFSPVSEIKTPYDHSPNKTAVVAECPYFVVRRMHFDLPVEKDFNGIDSFVLYMCIEGSVSIEHGDGEKTSLTKGETVLIPAELKNLNLTPHGLSTLLEIYIP